MNISDCSSVELLIYNGSQAPGKFSFRALSIEDITGLGHANSDLKALILKETPGLAEALKNKQIWLAEKLVLRWAAPRITWDGGGYALATSGYDAAQIYYDFFQPHTMGVYCGGSSDFLHKVLNLFGLPNFPMDFGTHKPNLTHVTVIVPFKSARAMRGPVGALRWSVATVVMAMLRHAVTAGTGCGWHTIHVLALLGHTPTRHGVAGVTLMMWTVL